MPDPAARWKSIALAIVIAFAAAAIQWALRPLVGPRIPFLFFFPAAGIAAMWLGAVAGGIVLGAGAVNAILWLEPVGSWTIQESADRISLAVYLIAAGVLVTNGSRFYALRRRAIDAEASLANQVRDLQALQDLGSRVMSMGGVDQQLDAIVSTLCRLLHADKGLVSLIDAGSGTLRAAASVGFSEAGRRAIESVDVGAGASGMAYLENRRVVIEDTEHDAHFTPFRELARREGFRSVHSRPLVNLRGEVFGAISVHFARPTRPGPRDDQVATLCAQMASVLTERHMLLADAMQLSRQVEVALESSAVPFCLLTPHRDVSGAVADYGWEFLNGAALRMLQLEAKEAIGQTVGKTLPIAWDEPRLKEELDTALQTGRSVAFELHAETVAGRPWFHVIASPCEGNLAVWFSDITARKRQEEALREADRRKDEFLATLAHELRNPLAPIRQATVIARSPAATQAQRVWSLEVIDRQVGNMAVLLDDLLDVSRITRGKLELRKVSADMRQVIDAALEFTRPAFDARQQQLHLEWPDRPLPADIDVMRMSQVVGNLLTNASRYTPAGGSIWLSGREENGHVVVDVRDDGIGIPPESLESVFEMFTQLRTPQSLATVGLGIGLALARGIANMHDATLSAHSDGPGCGSTFTLRLPLSAAAIEKRHEPTVRDAACRARRVLVADDNRDAAESLAEVLRMEGHEVALAFDGGDALAKFHEMQPEVALLDIGMPSLSGNDVAAAIRASPAGSNTVLVAITGWGQERDRAAARDAGFDFHFTKPIDPGQVLELVARLGAANVAS